MSDSSLSNLLKRIPIWVVNGVTVTLGLTLAECLFALTGGVSAALPAFSGALCASLADVVTTTDRVARRVAAASVASIVIAVVFVILRSQTMLMVPLVAVLVMCVMLIHSWGPKAGAVSFAALMSLVFVMSAPETRPISPMLIVWCVSGMAVYWIWAVGSAWLLQATWRRLSLSAVIDDVASLVSMLADRDEPGRGPNSATVNGLQQMIADRLQNARDLIFGNADGDCAHLETTVLLRLIDVRDHAMSGRLEVCLSELGESETEAGAIFKEISNEISRALHAVADQLRVGTPMRLDYDFEQGVENFLAKAANRVAANEQASILIVTESLRHQIDQVRLMESLLAPDWSAELPCRRTDLRRYIVPDEWRFAAVRANLNLSTPVFRHALATGIAAGLGYAICRLVPWAPHPQWVVLTIAVVKQGNLAQSLARRNARILGTLSGCLIVGLITLSDFPQFQIACVVVAAGIAHAYLGVRYSVTAAAAAVMAVLQAHLLFPFGGFSIAERLGDTLFGALIGWAASYTLPNWEKRHLAADVRSAVDAIRTYAAEALRTEVTSLTLPRYARQRAYDASRLISAATARSLVEPAAVRVPIAEISALVSAANVVMSHISSLRLTLTLHSQETPSTPLANALLEAAQKINDALQVKDGSRTTSIEPHLRPSLNLENDLDQVPGLTAIIRTTLEDSELLASRARDVIDQLEQRQ